MCFGKITFGLSKSYDVEMVQDTGGMFNTESKEMEV